MKMGRQTKLGLMLLKRDPNLSFRKPETLSLARSRGMNKADMFENLLNENNFFGDPARIHNVDETGLQLNNRPEKNPSYERKTKCDECYC
ncbi:hypothetical protein PR048_014351 [Dryococelus australis]|uniref:Uncharacterized protein n=1 Tax=Dryococelus australis TaxID=614101 RepID=A0ABQ9HDX6_9NEOP|nr:hypothetical protein PR048_014351 [Dryococelus australis]